MSFKPGSPPPLTAAPKIDLNIALEIATRIRVLVELSRKIAEAVGTSESSMTILEFGVSRRYINRLTFLLLGEPHQQPGLVEVEFDWNRHVAILSNESGSNKFEFDPKIDMISQASPIMKRVIEEIPRRMKEENLTQCKMIINYASTDGEKAMKDRFSLVAVSTDNSQLIQRLRKDAHRIVDHRLDEVGIIFNIGNHHP